MFEFAESVFLFWCTVFSVFFCFAVLRLYFVPYICWHLFEKREVSKLRYRTKFYYDPEEWGK